MPATIRIMHVVDSLGKGGLENGVVNLIEHMDASRFEQVVCAIRGLGANADRLPRERVQVICLGKRETDSPIQIAALVRAIRAIKPDVVHSRNWGAVEAVLAGRLVRSCAVVHSEHGLETDGSARQPWRRICFRRLAFELADRVLSVSCQLRDFHTRLTGFRAGGITVIHNGVDGQKFFPDPAIRVKVREELGLSDEEICVGCVGSLVAVKDHMTLLHAVAGVAEVCGNWRLLIVGDGPEFSKLRDFVHAHPAWEQRVAFLGSSSRVPEILRAMDVYVLPSANEGISNSLLEAMSTGIPVIVTATGGNPEVVIDGESGLLFPVGDSRELTEQLLRLVSRKDLRAQLGQKALRRVREEFSIDSMVRNYEQVYESLTREAKASEQAMARA